MISALQLCQLAARGIYESFQDTSNGLLHLMSVYLPQTTGVSRGFSNFHARYLYINTILFQNNGILLLYRSISQNVTIKLILPQRSKVNDSLSGTH